MSNLDQLILLRLREVSKREPLESAISLHQFFGIDIIPFAVGRRLEADILTGRSNYPSAPQTP